MITTAFESAPFFEGDAFIPIPGHVEAVAEAVFTPRVGYEWTIQYISTELVGINPPIADRDFTLEIDSSFANIETPGRIKAGYNSARLSVDGPQEIVMRGGHQLKARVVYEEVSGSVFGRAQFRLQIDQHRIRGNR